MEKLESTGRCFKPPVSDTPADSVKLLAVMETYAKVADGKEVFWKQGCFYFRFRDLQRFLKTTYGYRPANFDLSRVLRKLDSEPEGLVQNHRQGQWWRIKLEAARKALRA